MASVKCLLQSKSENSNIYIQFSISRKQVYKRKTGFVINPKDWSKPLSQPIQKDEITKKLKSKLDKLATFIIDAYNDSISKDIDITADWLQLQIDLYNNKIPLIDLDILTAYIQKYIDDAPYKPNGKKELGLSNGRIKNLKLLCKLLNQLKKHLNIYLLNISF